MGLIGILAGLALLVWFAFRGWSVLLLAPIAAVVAAAFAGQPLLAHWTQTFMGSAAGFVAPGLLEREDDRVLEVLGDVLHIDADLARDIGDHVAAVRLAPEIDEGLADAFDQVFRGRTLRRLATGFLLSSVHSSPHPMASS